MAYEHLIFRISSIIVGVILAYFTFGVMRATRGATKGWFYFAIAGYCFMLFAIGTSIFTLLKIPIGAIISGILFIPGTIILVASLAVFLKDFSIKKIRIWKPVNIIVCHLALIILLFAGFAIFTDVPLLPALLTIILFDAAIANIHGSVFAYNLWKGTKKGIWLSLLIFMLLFTVGQISALYSAQCCTGASDIAQCNDYSLEYVSLVSLPCSGTGVQAGLMGYNVLPIGSLILVGSFFHFWRKLAR